MNDVMNPFLRDELAAIIAEEIAAAPPTPAEPPPAPSMPAWQWFEFNDSVVTMRLEQTPRARAIRRISYIADAHKWGSVVAKTLDRKGAHGIEDLPDGDLDALLEQMENYVLSAQTCCDDPDALPAR